MLINKYAKQYNVSSFEMYKIVDCETGHQFDPKMQSLAMKDGIREDSWGLAQIHLPAHPSTTKEMAQDPDYALDFLAKNLSKGHPEMWTCYSILKNQGVLK